MSQMIGVSISVLNHRKTKIFRDLYDIVNLCEVANLFALSWIIHLFFFLQDLAPRGLLQLPHPHNGPEIQISLVYSTIQYSDDLVQIKIESLQTAPTQGFWWDLYYFIDWNR